MARIERDPQKPLELILPVFTQWSRVGAVQSILADLENGQFNDAALLWSQMLRDDRIRAVMDVRVNSVLGAPLHMEPSKETAGAKRVAEDAEELWWQMVPRSELTALYTWGLGLGVGIARRVWDRWQPRLKVWHPAALFFRLDDDKYYLRTGDQGVIPIEPDDPNWVLFTPYGYKYARTSGLIRSLAMLYLCRQWAFRDRARHSERHGIPFLVGTTPAEADRDDKAAYKSALANVGSETVIIAPKGQDGNQWGVELVESKADSHEVFSSQIDHLDAAIAIVALGQSMSTQAPGGLGAKANAGDSVRSDIKRFDAETIGDLGEQILKPWSEYNYGKDLCPRPCLEVDPPADGAKRALELSTLGDALDKLEKYGADARQLLTETGVPMLSPEEAAKKAEELEQKAQEAMQSQQNKEPDSDDNQSENAEQPAA